LARQAYTASKRKEIESRIKTTALTLFAKAGYRAVSLRSIASEMGLSTPALYRYYENKGALLDALRADGFHFLKRTLHEVRQTASSPVDAASECMRAYLKFAMTQSELYCLMYELDQGSIGESSISLSSRRSAFSEAEGMARDLLEMAQRTGDANQMAHLFWISAHGLAALAVANQLDLGSNFEELIEPVIKTLLNGVLQQLEVGNND
jgi:AcrR family transcriptional regulator